MQCSQCLKVFAERLAKEAKIANELRLTKAAEDERGDLGGTKEEEEGGVASEELGAADAESERVCTFLSSFFSCLEDTV